MRNIAVYKTKYSKNAVKSQAIMSYNRIAATTKWIEYSLDLVEMQKLLSSLTREQKHDLLSAITVAERKRDYMYKHPNFKLEDAIRDFKRARRLLNL